MLSLCTARHKPFLRMPSGKSDLLSTDVLHALGLIRLTGPKLLLRVKYMHQNQFLGDLSLEFDDKIKKEWKHRHWPYPINQNPEDFRLKLNLMALIEVINPNFCKDCGGIGSQPTQGGKVPQCPVCYGSGKKKPSEASRARYMGMNYETWRRPWAEIYNNVYKIGQLWEETCLSALFKRLIDTDR